MDARRQRRVRALALACAVIASIAPAIAHGAPASAVTEQVSAAKARIDSMQRELASAMSGYDAAATELAKTRAQVKANRAHLKKLQTSMEDGQKRLSAEVRFMYRTDGNGFAVALLTAPTIDAFASRLLALSRIAGRDAETIARIKHDRAQAVKLASELARRERVQKAQVAQVAARRAKAQSALTGQQRYVDSLSSKVASAIGSGSGRHAHSKGSSGGSPTRLAWAKVEGRSGRYAVLANQPKSYAPSGITFSGTATWYGNVRPNMKTSSGRPFDENELTCAHKSLPFGTRVAVTYKGRRVIVTVTDRGPWGKGRVIDLTKRAASIIGLKSAGVGRVRCEVVRPQ